MPETSLISAFYETDWIASLLELIQSIEKCVVTRSQLSLPKKWFSSAKVSVLVPKTTDTEAIQKCVTLLWINDQLATSVCVLKVLLPKEKKLRMFFSGIWCIADIDCITNYWPGQHVWVFVFWKCTYVVVFVRWRMKTSTQKYIYVRARVARLPAEPTLVNSKANQACLPCLRLCVSGRG